MRRSLTVLVAAGVLLGACGSDVTAGEVRDKYIDPESTYFIWQCMSYDSKGYCTWNMMVPHTDDEDHVVTIVNCQDYDECRTAQFEVDPDTYNSLDVGDWADFDPDDEKDGSE